jgi:ParB family transcriptional regulator, chromosome partitioning protein
MRHESHFVEHLSRPAGLPVGKMIPAEDIHPNPGQPRRALGDLTELAASIREKGILEPIIVRSARDGYEIIAGERRYRAACEVGLDEIPCVVRESSDAEVMEIALIENLQRKDLSPFEEADGLKALAESYRYTHEMMAERLGRSRTSVTETLSLAAMPAEIRDLCRLADIQSKSMLLQVVRQSTSDKMAALVDKLKGSGANTRQAAREITKAPTSKAKGRPKNFVFKHQPSDKSFSLSLQFRRSAVPKEEILAALQRIIDTLRSEE